MIVGIGGGIGASRLWRPLAREVGEDELTLVVNTGDDLWHHGLRICPDLDTTLYALAGLQDTDRGWGRSGETFEAMSMLAELGEQVWFHLGDRDLATHLLRTGRLHAGTGLAEITRQLAVALGAGTRVLPMSEQEVPTRLLVEGGEMLHYQEFLVRHAARPQVRRVVHAGATEAAPAPGVLDAIAAADLVVVAPSNPLASVSPVLAVPGIRDALSATPAPVVAVTPIVSGVPITDPGETRRAASRAALLASTGRAHTATSAAELLAQECDLFVLDNADAVQASAIADLGLEVVLADTLPGGDLVERLRALAPQPIVSEGR